MLVILIMGAAALVALIAQGVYEWTIKRRSRRSSSPMPPTGGVASPVPAPN